MAQRVLIHGATGETGGDILNGLIEDGDFVIAALVRPESAQKPATESLRRRHVKIVVADLASQGVEEIARLVAGYDTIISAVAASALLDQLKLVDAAAIAGTKRFVPCGFTAISPPGGVMRLIRGEKEKVDYAFVGESNTRYGDGVAPNLMIDKRDIGKFTARIIRDGRTLNKRVFLHAEVLTQNEIWAIVEEKSGEKIDAKHATLDGLVEKMLGARGLYSSNPSDMGLRFGVISAEYAVSKHVRKDNNPENARYLGYLDTRELYPDFLPRTFAAFVDELLAGELNVLYQGRFGSLRKNDT